jgi:hypothetical protein
MTGTRLRGNRCGGGRLQRPQQPQDIPRGMEMAEKIGLEFLPPPGV